ncbi:p-loop containing nucleoside triphosphate hydrolase protein [Mycena indigotica]|uniref:RNA helicase n=1 Tax=Mycena indigotica TaxID=2126181 RepID=A0A8H6VWY4_9AGAR|nr:p-loop containing nucleoside triphosphate hydrolase protein [Mycena indigotica]KAF7291219.1 p-loop containing nucleoside triphosphate hydrolase protein [Mycena indigotica]
MHLPTSAPLFIQMLARKSPHTTLAAASIRKKDTMSHFRSGEVKILLATEAAGMGCDIPNIELVVQFMVPRSLSIWLQRAGRAGRNPTISARAVLLVQPSVFKEVMKDGETKFQKTVESGLRSWVEADNCRRDVVDEYFDSGVERAAAPTGACCDNGDGVPLPEDIPSAGPVSLAPTPVAARYKYRLPADRPGALKLITDWRADVMRRLYSRRPWGLLAFLPADTIERLVKRTGLTSIEELIAAGWSKTHAMKHGVEVITLLSEHDARCKQAREETRKREAEVQREEAAKRRKVIDERKAAAAAAKTKTPRPKSARKSRAKHAQPLQPSAIPNLWMSPSPSSSPYLTYPVIPTTPLTPIPYYPAYCPAPPTPSPLSYYPPYYSTSFHDPNPTTPFTLPFINPNDPDYQEALDAYELPDPQFMIDRIRMHFYNTQDTNNSSL